jgi:hypothetical protein
MARKSIVEFYDTDKGRTSKEPAIVVSTQWDSKDSVPIGHETSTINLAHTTTTNITQIHNYGSSFTLLFTSPINKG